MPATLCIAATLHAGNAPGKKLLRHLLADLPRPFRACYIGAPHDDDRSWAKVTLDHFEREYGVRPEAPRLSEKKIDVARAREAIETAQVLYLDGGDTVACVRHAERHGLVSAFAKAGKTAFLSFGLSGGACAMAPYTIGYDDEEQGEIVDCFGMGCPLPVDVHDEKEDWPEMRALLEIVAKDGKRGEAAGIVIPTGSALIVGSSGALVSWGKAKCEKRRLKKGGAWKVEAIP